MTEGGGLENVWAEGALENEDPVPLLSLQKNHHPFAIVNSRRGSGAMSLP